MMKTPLGKELTLMALTDHQLIDCNSLHVFVFRDRHKIATKKDKILCIFMIVLAVFSNLVAIYSDAYALLKRNESPRE